MAVSAKDEETCRNQGCAVGGKMSDLSKISDSDLSKISNSDLSKCPTPTLTPDSDIT